MISVNSNSVVKYKTFIYDSVEFALIILLSISITGFCVLRTKGIRQSKINSLTSPMNAYKISYLVIWIIGWKFKTTKSLKVNK